MWVLKFVILLIEQKLVLICGFVFHAGKTIAPETLWIKLFCRAQLKVCVN